KRSAANAITLCNYDKYQSYSAAVTAYVSSLKTPPDQPANNQPATSRQPAGNQPATDQPPANNQNLRNEEREEGKTPSTAHAVEGKLPASRQQQQRSPDGGAAMDGEELAQDVIDAAWKLTNDLAIKVKGNEAGPRG